MFTMMILNSIIMYYEINNIPELCTNNKQSCNRHGKLTYPSYTHQNTSKLRHTQQKQIISNHQPKQPHAYYCLWKGSPTPSSKPELVHFSLEPRRRRSTTLIRDICIRTRTQLVTEDKDRHHLAESCADTRPKKAWKEAWATPSRVMM